MKSIITLIKSYNADIVVLTETNSKTIDLGSEYFEQHTAHLTRHHDDVDFYKEGKIELVFTQNTQ
ncbi:hypothetical protein [Flavobacterium gillisiae]|uniref:hypothetical protein n=1 Tax=Flavobacterium gillisiae TaxID=150146 RepID=UPI00115F8EF1|nr:hypothetical protein [Flavobacterium gillisiae]